MADQIDTTGAAETVDPNAVEEPQESADAVEMDGAGQGGAEEVERLRVALKRANAEAAERRHKLDAFEEKERKQREAQMSELEKAQQRAEEAEQGLVALRADLEKRAVRHAVEMTATALRFYDPADAYALADLAKIEIDADGQVAGVEAALKALAKAKPHLVKAEQVANLNAQQRSSGNTYDEDELGELAAVYGVRKDLLVSELQRRQ